MQQLIGGMIIGALLVLLIQDPRGFFEKFEDGYQTSKDAVIVTIEKSRD